MPVINEPSLSALVWPMVSVLKREEACERERNRWCAKPTVGIEGDVVSCLYEIVNQQAAFHCLAVTQELITDGEDESNEWLMACVL